MAVNIGSVVAFLELDTSKYTKGFKSAANDLKVFMSDSATASQKINGLSSAMGTVGSTLTKSVTVPIVGIGVAALNVAKDFEQGMSNVQAISGATGDEFEALRDKAIELGGSTVFSATEVADAMTEMAKAGWDSQAIMDGMGGVLDAAAASGENLASVSTIVADAITGFGLSASDSTRVADLLTQAANSGTIGISDLGESFKYIAPLSQTFGFSIEDTTTAITALSTAGIKGSQAGTALRGMLTRLVKPTDQVAQAMSDLGITLTDSEGNFKSMDTILREMRGTFQNLTPEQQAYYASVLAGTEGVSALNTLLGMSQEEYDAIAASMDNAGGVAKETADVMQDNLAGAMEQLFGALESAGIVIGDALIPTIRDLAEWITNVVEDFNSLDEGTQQAIVKFALFAAGIGPVMMVGGKLLKTFTTLGSGALKLGSNVSMLTKAFMTYYRSVNPTSRGIGNIAAGFKSMGTAIMGVLTPTNILIGSIAALTVGMFAASEMDKKRIESLGALKGEEKELADQIDKTHESYQQMNESKQQTIEGITQEADETRNLWTELQNIVDANGRIKEGYEERAATITGLLSQALGTEIGITDGVIQNYGELQESIDTTIEKMQALALQEGLQESYAEAIRNRASAQQEYNDALALQEEYQGKINDIQSEMNAKQDEWAEAARKGGRYAAEAAKEQGEYSEQLKIYQEKLDNATESVEKAEEAYKGYNDTIRNYEELQQAIASGSVEAMSLAVDKIEQGFVTAENASRSSLEKQRDTIQKGYEEAAAALAAGAEGVTQEEVDRLKALLDAANAELKTKTDEQTNILLIAFSNLGIQLPQALQTSLMTASPMVQQQVLNLLQTIQNGASLKGAELTTLFSNLGMELPTAMNNSIAALAPSAQAQAINLLMQFQYGEAAQRPAVLQQLQDLGVQVDNSWAQGIDSNVGTITNSSTSAGEQGYNAMNTAISKNNLNAPNVNAVSNAASEAESAWQTMNSILSGRSISVAIRGVVESVTGQISGSHANGLSYVPYNGYIAELHKGERVLTADENRAYNAGARSSSVGGGDTFNFYSTVPSPYEYARQVKKAKKELLSGL